MKSETEPATSSVATFLAEATLSLASAGIPQPRAEATWLLADCLGVARAWVMGHPEAVITPEVALEADRRVERRAAREPFAYVVGHKEFFGLDLEVGPDVLIPRPETELLVDAALSAAHHLGEGNGSTPLVADLGTGSGAIAIALAARIPALRILALDRSREALDVARRNAQRHGVADRIEFRSSNLLDSVEERLDLLVANLPYVPSATIHQLEPEVRDYEPRSALDGGPDGTALIRGTLEAAFTRLAQRAVLLFEIGEGQGEALESLARRLYPQASVRVVRDYAGLERILSVQLA